MSHHPNRLYEFGPFRLDAGERRLLRDGEAVALTPKAFDLLLVLVGQPSHLLDKEELLQRVWPDTVVEEANLSYNVSLIRKALGDGEDGQKYIETIPKRGYRFVADVQEVRAAITWAATPAMQVGESGPAANVDGAPPARESAPAETTMTSPERYKRAAGLAVAVLSIAGAVLAWFITRPVEPPKVTGSTQVTSDGHQKSGSVTDGARLYFSVQVDGKFALAQVATAGGETFFIHSPFPNADVLDISPRRTELLVISRLATEYEAPLWIVPLPGGAPRRVGDATAYGAAWSPDGSRIVYSQGPDLWLVRSDGTAPRKLATMDGRIGWLRWSPDGSRLRYTVTNRQRNSGELWEADSDGSGARPLLPGWNNPAAECCGNWTADGRYYVFQSTRQGTTNIWARREKVALFRRSGQETVQLTFGPLNFSAPVPSLDGRRLFVIGDRLRGELMRYDAQTRTFCPYLAGMSAHRLTFSRDGQWVAYVTYPEGSLWRSRVDGSDRLQLTAPPLETHLPRWSPDGTRLAFTASSPGQPWKIHLASVDGGMLQQLTPDRREERNPNWSPDGQTIIFDALLDASGNQAIYRCEVGSRHVSLLPGSEGLMSPRWSPDGRYIVALTINSQRLMLLDMSSGQWSELAGMQRINYPQWSRGGKHVYFCGISPDDSAVFRVRVDSRQVERVADLNMRLVQTNWGSWMGLAPDDSPLVLRDTGIQDIYALEWRAP